MSSSKNSRQLLVRDQQPWRFDTAAPRWHARLCSEARLTLDEAHLALAALHMVRGPTPAAGGKALASICEAHRLDDTVEVLDAWLTSRERKPWERAGDSPGA